MYSLVRTSAWFLLPKKERSYIFSISSERKENILLFIGSNFSFRYFEWLDWQTRQALTSLTTYSTLLNCVSVPSSYTRSTYSILVLMELTCNISNNIPLCQDRKKTHLKICFSFSESPTTENLFWSDPKWKTILDVESAMTSLEFGSKMPWLNLNL